jgi:hypothetical protein
VSDTVSPIKRLWSALWRKEPLSIQVGASLDECQNLLRSAITPAFGKPGRNFLRIADAESVRELRWQGVLLQGRIDRRGFEVWCIEPEEGIRYSDFRPHCEGHLVASGDGTLVTGTIRVPIRVKVMSSFLWLLALGMIFSGVTGIYILPIFGAIIGLLTFMILGNLNDASEEWEQLPRDVSLAFDGHTLAGSDS